MSGLVSILVVVLLAIGLVGSVVPFLPGTLLIFAAALVHAFYTDFTPLGPGRLAVLGALTALAHAIDYLAGAMGVRRLGGSRIAMLGAVLGAVVGVFFGPLGLIVGPILGAMLFEMLLRNKKLEDSIKSGAGSALGMLAGIAVKLVVALTMIGLFLWWTRGSW